MGQSDRSAVPVFAIETPDTFNVPPGADPDVSAEEGGNGFEEIAEAEGWESGSISEEDLRLTASPRATKGGEIRMGIFDFPATFRAYGMDENTQITRIIHGYVYEPLITVHPLSLEFLPALASHWKVGDDGQTYWFRIDPNARFSDGHPVTTEDVLATYRLAIDEGILSPYTNAFYAEFEEPEAVSKYIFRVRSKTKEWKNFLYFGGTSILPAHGIGDMSGSEYLEAFQYAMPPGSGPYVVEGENVTVGRRVSLTRRTNYWAADYPQNREQFNFDRITLITVNDERLMLERFRKGELDLYLINRAQWYQEEFNDEKVKRGLVQVRRIYNHQPQGVSGIVFNMREPPFDDQRIRRAVAYLFDREKLVRELMYGQYTMTDSYYPGSVYENPSNEKIRYNEAKAAELMKEAGYTKRNSEGILVHEQTDKPLVVKMPVDESMVRMLVPIQQDLKEAGIKVEFRKVDGPTLFKNVNERNFSMAYMSWSGLLYPNPKSSFHSELADQPNTSNLAGFKNARADELIERELVTYDQEERVKILRELDSILVSSNQYALAWYAPFTRVAYWNRFGHPEFYLGKISDWRYILSSWWVSPEKSRNLAEAQSDDSINLGEEERDVLFWPQFNSELRTQD